MLAKADADPEIAVVVVRGAGDRGFCAGADLKESRDPRSLIDIRQTLAFNSWIDAFDEFSKPLIAAVHGYCLGGGLEIAMACDIRIASPDAIFALPEVSLGLIPGAGGTQRLPRLIGLSRALDMLMLGDRMNAQDALRAGLVTRLAASSTSLQAEAAALAERLAIKPSGALAFVKEAARRAADMDLASGLRVERDLFAILSTVPKEGPESAFQGGEQDVPISHTNQPNVVRSKIVG